MKKQITFFLACCILLCTFSSCTSARSEKDVSAELETSLSAIQDIDLETMQKKFVGEYNPADVFYQQNQYVDTYFMVKYAYKYMQYDIVSLHITGDTAIATVEFTNLDFSKSFYEYYNTCFLIATLSASMNINDAEQLFVTTLNQANILDVTTTITADINLIYQNDTWVVQTDYDLFEAMAGNLFSARDAFLFESGYSFLPSMVINQVAVKKPITRAENETAEQALNIGLQSLQKTDFETSNEYLNLTFPTVFSNQNSYKIFQLLFQDMDYQILSVDETDDTAIITIEFTNIDADVAFASYVDDLFALVDTKGEDMSDDDIFTLVETLVNNNRSITITTTITIHLTKESGKWVVHYADETSYYAFINAITGNYFTTMNRAQTEIEQRLSA